MRSSSSLVIGYIRVSTDEQTLGPEAQRAALDRWCATRGARLVAVHEDIGVSGGAQLERRPGLLGAIEELRVRAAGVLLVTRRDRLARDVVVAAMVERLVERHGGRILSADGTGDGDGPEAALMRTIIDAFASYERALIRMRTKVALQVKRDRGERIGHLPFGYRLGGDGVHLEIDVSEQQVLAELRTLRAAGYSLRAIAAKLNETGRPARGSKWHSTSVARILKRTGEGAAR